jgi:CRISPR-associated protein Cas1
MIERIIDLSTEPAKLAVRLDQLVIERNDKETVSVPLFELGALVLAHRQIILTHSVLSGITAHGGIIIACDEKSMPIGMMIPIEQHHLQAERFRLQAEAPLPTKKQVWKQIVQAKLAAQGRLLAEFRNSDSGLIEMSKKVRSGDPDNIEGTASRRYWTALFDDPSFKREREAEDQNRFLNYGYAVLRAMTARAICAAGLHPSLGIHHHNRYDAFCLADDLMEPFRPLVDRAVVHLTVSRGKDAPMDRETKSALISALTARHLLQDESRTLFDILTRMASSLAKIFAGEEKELLLPDLLLSTTDEHR